MAFHGYQDLPWEARGNAVDVADSGNAATLSVDVLTVGGKSILPHSVSLEFYSTRTNPDVNIYLQFSKDGSIWAPAGGAQAKSLFVDNLAEDLTGGDGTAIYTHSVQSRYMRMYYESLASSGGPTNMTFAWAPIFGETPSS